MPPLPLVTPLVGTIYTYLGSSLILAGDMDRQRLLTHGVHHVSQSGYNTVDYHMETTTSSQTSGLSSTGECPPRTQVLKSDRHYIYRLHYTHEAV